MAVYTGVVAKVMVMVLWIQLLWHGTRGETCFDPNQSKEDLFSALKASNLMIDGLIIYAKKTHQSVEVDIRNYNCTDIGIRNRCIGVPRELKLHYYDSEHSRNSKIRGCTLRGDSISDALAADRHDTRKFLLKTSENKGLLDFETVAIPLRPVLSVRYREDLDLYGMNTLQFSLKRLPSVNAYFLTMLHALIQHE